MSRSIVVLLLHSWSRKSSFQVPPELFKRTPPVRNTVKTTPFMTRGKRWVPPEKAFLQGAKNRRSQGRPRPLNINLFSRSHREVLGVHKNLANVPGEPVVLSCTPSILSEVGFSRYITICSKAYSTASKLMFLSCAQPCKKWGRELQLKGCPRIRNACSGISDLLLPRVGRVTMVL